MVSAKEIVVKPISSQDAARLVKAIHYSGKVVNNSTLHFGVFLNDRLEGVMSFGNSLDKRKVQGLVRDTKWNDFVELNRMAFSARLPRNSESRALSIAFRLIKKHYPNIEWIISFADGTQCGDGTIYRASGFVLTQININKTLILLPWGETIANICLSDTRRPMRMAVAKRLGINVDNGKSTIKPFLDAGCKVMQGFQLRYIYFLNPNARERLTVPVIPFSKIDEIGAGMYKGIRRVSSADSGTAGDQLAGGGAIPTDTLQVSEAT